MTTPSLIDFINAIEDVDTFSVKNGGLTALPSAAFKNRTLSYTEAELIAIDSRLPFAIKAALRESGRMIMEDRTDRMDSTYLRNTLLFWTQARVLRMLSGMEKPYRTIELNEVDLDCSPIRVWVGATVYQTRFECLGDGQSVEVAERTTYSELRVCPDWLEETFPGWQKRFGIAETLGLTARERSDHVLVSAVKPAVGLADSVTFEN